MVGTCAGRTDLEVKGDTVRSKASPDAAHSEMWNGSTTSARTWVCSLLWVSQWYSADGARIGETVGVRVVDGSADSASVGTGVGVLVSVSSEAIGNTPMTARQTLF